MFFNFSLLMKKLYFMDRVFFGLEVELSVVIFSVWVDIFVVWDVDMVFKFKKMERFIKMC